MQIFFIYFLYKLNTKMQFVNFVQKRKDKLYKLNKTACHYIHLRKKHKLILKT